ncbi:MAG: ferritin-like domain-containing protein [Micropepsaceae bacterium]
MPGLRAAFLERDPRAKARATLALTGGAPEPGWPDRPGRPDAPRLVTAREVAKRSPATPEGRIALLHALAHIELNAIDLALDIVGRFDLGPQNAAFAADWLTVAREEAKHFLMLADRLEALGSHYGALDAHDGLWQTALASRADLVDRLAIAPLTHEARGLDVTPAMIAKLKSAGDGASAAILQVIYRDEIGHVATGYRWFEAACHVRGLDPESAFQASLTQIGLARPHPPFNEAARRQAGLTPPFDITFAAAAPAA